MPREGHDSTICSYGIQRHNFNPRAPRGARLRHIEIAEHLVSFQSTCPARGTTTYSTMLYLTRSFQSTCPARGTTRGTGKTYGAFAISIHVPREGHDIEPLPLIRGVALFQSTCPARGTTYATLPQKHHLPHFNPRAPRGARHLVTDVLHYTGDISIHVPREGHDCIPTSTARAAKLFQSTCPARGTTHVRTGMTAFHMISIHVPREGHDQHI